MDPTELENARDAVQHEAYRIPHAIARRLIATVDDEQAKVNAYRMALEIVWEAITPTMMEEQLANFIAGYVRLALDNPASTVLRETHAELVKNRALDGAR